MNLLVGAKVIIENKKTRIAIRHFTEDIFTEIFLYP